ncbi:MAG: hypothetical protein QXK37_06620 [Candidatus Woesearchaeota archaeon]
MSLDDQLFLEIEQADAQKRGAKMFRMTKEIAQREISGVPEDKVFWLHDGRILKNLFDLVDALKDIPPEIFTHHVNEGKNDFANWINEVIGDKKLADEIRNHRDAISILNKVAKRLESVGARYKMKKGSGPLASAFKT